MREIAPESCTDIPAAHGPDGTLELPDWPPLTLSEADALLRLYPDAGGAQRLVTVSPRPFSAASIVETPQGNLFVKRHHFTVRNRAGLLEEHRLIDYLSKAQWPGGKTMVQAPLRDAGGETVNIHDAWIYEVHPVAKGLDLYRDAHSWTPFLSVEHARKAGEALAALHTASEAYDAPQRVVQQLVTSWTIFADDDPLRKMETYLEQRPELQTYARQRHWQRSMDELFLPWHQKLRPYLPHLKQLWTHNDFHASNLMWSNENQDAAVTAIVDFGLADRTNAVHDLATAIERNGIAWLHIAGLQAPASEHVHPGQDTNPDQDVSLDQYVHLGQIDALLAGYEVVKPLTAIERHALVAMLPLVHCEFALSETDYFLSVLHDPAKAYLGYEGYFLGHAAWFNTPAGAELLRHLGQWADAAEVGGQSS